LSSLCKLLSSISANSVSKTDLTYRILGFRRQKLGCSWAEAPDWSGSCAAKWSDRGWESLPW
jgi:hypothetical protein